MDLSQTQHKRTKDMMDQSMAGYKATETINKKNARTYEYKDPETGSSRYFKAWGEMNTIGTGPNALKQMDLRKGMVQEVTKDGKPIGDGKASGDVFSGGVAIDGNRIINLEAERGTERQRKDVEIKREEKGKRTDIGDHTSIGNTASYHLGSNNISPHGLFQVGGMNLAAASVERDGDQYRIIGTNHLGYHVEMQGRSKSSPSVNVKDGKYDGLKDFEMTNLKVSQTRDTEISNTYTDRNKFTIDQNDDIAMSNLNKLRTYYNESPEEFVKNHPDIIMAYGVGKNALENFKEITEIRGAVKKWENPQKPSPQEKAAENIAVRKAEKEINPAERWKDKAAEQVDYMRRIRSRK